MTVYVDDARQPGNDGAGELSHLLADVPSELDAFANKLGVIARVREAGRPWAYAEIFPPERLKALELGARPVASRAALDELVRRVRAFRWPNGVPRGTPFDAIVAARIAREQHDQAAERARPAAAPATLMDTPEDGPPPEPGLIRHDPPLVDLMGIAREAMAGVFVCKRGPGPARFNAASPRHAWDDSVEPWHRCMHCGVLYRSIKVSGSGWGKQWEWPDGWGGLTLTGDKFPACRGPEHARKPA